MALLWAETNCNVPGIHVFKISQNVLDDTPVEPIELVAPIVESETSSLCEGSLIPKVTPILTHNSSFVVVNCDLPNHENLSVTFLTTLGSFQALSVKYDKEQQVVSGMFPFLASESLAGAKVQTEDESLSIPLKLVSFSATVSMQNRLQIERLEESQFAVTWPREFVADLQTAEMQITESSLTGSC